MLNTMSEEELSQYPIAILPRMPARRGSDCPQCEAFRPEPQRSGNLNVDPEIVLTSPGFPVRVAFYSNSASTANGPYGYGRTISPNLTAQASGSPVLVTLTRDNGAQASYLFSGGSYVAQTPGCLNSLVEDTTNGYWKETTLDGMVTAYPLNTTGQITSVAFIQDSCSNTHTMTYSSGLLSNIQDPAGRLVSFGYSSGLLQSVEDWAGRRTTLAYDTVTASPLNLLTTITGPTGCQTGYQYSTFTQYSGGSYLSQWQLSGITDPNGAGTSYLFDQQGRVTNRIIQGVGGYTHLYGPGTMTTIDPMGGVMTQSLGSNYALNGTQNQLGALTTYTRNANLQETSRLLPNGGRWTTNYDGSGRVSSTVSPLNLRTSYSYDSYSNQLTVQTPDGAVVTNVWGFAGSSFDTTGAKRRLQAQINQLGNITSFGFTAQGLQSWSMDPTGALVTLGYNSFGDQVSRQDAMGFTWTTTRDLAGNPTSQMNPLGAIWSQTFDNQNRPLVATDPLNNQTQVGYDSVGNKTVEISPLGFRTTWQYNVFDMPTLRQDALGGRWTEVYDSLSNHIASIDALGNANSTIFNAASQPIAQVNPIGARTSSVLDSTGRPIATQSALGFLSSVTWDLDNRQIATTDSLGQITSLTLDPNGRTIAVQNPLGFLASTLYSAASQVIAQVDALNNRSTTVFDPRGLVIAQINPLGQAVSTIFNANQAAIASMDAAGYLTSTTLDSAGRAIARIDANNNLSSTVFDAANNGIAQINALNARSSTVFDANSNPIVSIDSLNRSTTSVMDALDRVQATISPMGFITSINRDAAGRTVSTQNALGALYSSVFDNASRQIATVSPLGYRTSTIFNIGDQVIANQNSLGFLTSAVFDANGNQIATVSPLNFRSSVVFDQASQQVATIDSLGFYATSIFAANGKLIASQNELGAITSFVLDAASRRTCVVDANGGRSTTIFTSRGLTAATQDQMFAFGANSLRCHAPERSDLAQVGPRICALTSFTQDANGNDILRVDAGIRPTSYTIDSLNRTSGQVYIDGTRTTSVWDSAGQQTSSADSTGLYTYLWDLDSRKTAVQNPTGINLSYTLDAASNRLVLADSGGRTTYSWDIQSRLTNIQNALSEMTSITWDSLDREQHRVLANGMSISHLWDNAGNETQIQNFSPAGVMLAGFTNTYSATNNRIGVLELDSTLVTYGYDAHSQLINESRSGTTYAYNSSYLFDPNGNRTQKWDSGALTSSTFNAANELLVTTPPTGAATTSSYDANGNLAVQNTGGALTTQTWSAENRLLNLANPDGTSEQYQYSQDGLRKSKTTASGTTEFVWDEQNVLLETNTSNVIAARYTDYPGYWGGLASQNQSGASSWYGLDSQGSVRILVAADGTVTDIYSYKANGEELQSGSGTTNNMRYVGLYGYYRDRANISYVRARILASLIAGWMSRDPRGGEAPYTYGANRPTMYLDPSGEVEIVGVLPGSWQIGYWSSAHYQVDNNCCGIVDAFWDFFLDGQVKAPCSGWFVQEVRYELTSDDCDTGIAMPAEVAHFWEAWPIEAGFKDWAGKHKIVGRMQSIAKYTDEFGQPAPYPERCNGKFHAHGDAKFFCNSDVTGDDPANWKGADCQQHTPSIWCKKDMPLFWNHPVSAVARKEAIASHNADSRWRCCQQDPLQWNMASADHHPKKGMPGKCETP